MGKKYTEVFYETPKLLRPLYELRLKFLVFFDLPRTYFDLRHISDSVDRKLYDVMFIRHYERVHDFYGKPARFRERLEYKYTRFLYRHEMDYTLMMFYKYGNKDSHIVDTEDLPKKYRPYYVKWGILEDPSPELVELVHGVRSGDVRVSN